MEGNRPIMSPVRGIRRTDSQRNMPNANGSPRRQNTMSPRRNPNGAGSSSNNMSPRARGSANNMSPTRTTSMRQHPGHNGHSGHSGHERAMSPQANQQHRRGRQPSIQWAPMGGGYNGQHPVLDEFGGPRDPQQAPSMSPSQSPGARRQPSGMYQNHQYAGSAGGDFRLGSASGTSASGAFQPSNSQSSGSFSWRRRSMQPTEDTDSDDPQPDDDDGCSFPPLDFLYQKLFLDLREEGDDFDTILRKIVVSAGMVLVVFPIAFAIYMAAELGRFGVSAGAMTTLLIMFVFPLVWVPCFLYCRSTKELPDSLMDAWLIVTIVAVGILGSSLIDYPTPQLAFWLATLCILCRTQLMTAELCLCAIVYVLSMLNHAFMKGVAETTLVALPAPYRGSLLERVAYQVTGFTIGIVIVGALIMNMKEHIRHVNAAQSATLMSRKVATQLSRYDTEAVQRTLEAYHLAGEADPELLDTFGTIVDNLERFRPHLPNWMLNSMGKYNEAEDEDLKGDVQISRTNSLASMHLDSQSGSQRPGSAVSDDDGRLSQRTGSGFSLRGELNEGTAATGAKNTIHRDGSKVALKKASEAIVTVKPFLGKVTISIVEFIPDDTLMTNLRKSETVIGRFVDRVHTIASQTHAAIHSFIGDAVHVSWNTAHRAAQPEVKGARFLANIADDVGDSLLRAYGGVMTGEARAHFAGTKQTALTVSYRWRDALAAMMRYAKKSRNFYMDNATNGVSRFEVVTRGADALHVTEWRNTTDVKEKKLLMLHNVVREVDEMENNDEWMYVVSRPQNAKRGQRDPDSALHACLDGDYNTAIQELKEEIDLIRERRRRTETAIDEGTAAWVDDVDGDSADIEDDLELYPLFELKAKAERALAQGLPPSQFPTDYSDMF